VGPRHPDERELVGQAHGQGEYGPWRSSRKCSWRTAARSPSASSGRCANSGSRQSPSTPKPTAARSTSPLPTRHTFSDQDRPRRATSTRSGFSTRPRAPAQKHCTPVTAFSQRTQVSHGPSREPAWSGSARPPTRSRRWDRRPRRAGRCAPPASPSFRGRRLRSNRPTRWCDLGRSSAGRSRSRLPLAAAARA
jgi:hypothetical protein